MPTSTRPHIRLVNRAKYLWNTWTVHKYISAGNAVKSITCRDSSAVTSGKTANQKGSSGTPESAADVGAPDVGAPDARSREAMLSLPWSSKRLTAWAGPDLLWVIAASQILRNSCAKVSSEHFPTFNSSALYTGIQAVIFRSSPEVGAFVSGVR